MAKNNNGVKKIVDLWYETQMGHHKKCREKQLEFADMMWELYEEIYDPWLVGQVGRKKMEKDNLYTYLQLPDDYWIITTTMDVEIEYLDNENKDK